MTTQIELKLRSGHRYRISKNDVGTTVVKHSRSHRWPTLMERKEGIDDGEWRLVDKNSVKRYDEIAEYIDAADRIKKLTSTSTIPSKYNQKSIEKSITAYASLLWEVMNDTDTYGNPDWRKIPERIGDVGVIDASLHEKKPIAWMELTTADERTYHLWTQNTQKDTEYAELARKGEKISWLSEEGKPGFVAYIQEDRFEWLKPGKQPTIQKQSNVGTKDVDTKMETLKTWLWRRIRLSDEATALKTVDIVANEIAKHRQ